MRTGKADTYVMKLDKIVKARSQGTNIPIVSRAPSLSFPGILPEGDKAGYDSEVEIQQAGSANRGGITAQPGAMNAEAPNALSISVANISAMRDYYSWSQKQARIICWVAVGACAAGILVIMASLVLSVISALAFDKVLITAIGGMVTELFAGTTLIVYRSSLAQLNRYHKSLHEDQRFLSSVDLLWQFSSDTERDKMLASIIRNSLKINLALATEKEKPEEDAKKGEDAANN